MPHKDANDIQTQLKTLHCTANKLIGTFAQCSTAVKNSLSRVYCMPMYTCRQWCASTHWYFSGSGLRTTM